MNRSGFLLLLLLPLSLAACGVKGDLVPKGRPEPRAPEALVLRQQGDTILLEWDLPTANQDGTPLTDLAGFRVDLTTYPPGQFCPECLDQETIATIDLADPEPAIVHDGSVFYRDAGLDVRTGYRYRVRPFTAGGRSGPPAEAHRLLPAPPAPPVGVRSEALDRGVRLYWLLPGDVQQSGELLGVNIYAGKSGARLAPVPINLDPVRGNNYESFGLDNDTTYRFGLRTVVRIDDLLVESELSEIVDATPGAGL